MMSLHVCTCLNRQVGCKICQVRDQKMEKRGYMKIKSSQSTKKDHVYTRFEKHVLLIVTAKLGNNKIGK